MKNFIVIFASLLMTTHLFSQGIEFEHVTYAHAIAKAKQENKLVFMDCYTSWCGPCKYLSEKIFTQVEVGDYYNANFINIKMDMESEEGKRLLEKYQVPGYPTLLFLDASGEVQHLVVGAGDAERILELGKQALDPENNWRAMHQKFVDGERDVDFLKNYIMTAARARQPMKQASYIYFSNKGLDQLINEDDLDIIIVSVKSTNDPVFRFLVENKEQYYKIADKKRINNYIENTMSREIGMLGRQQKIEEMEAKKKELIALDKELGTKVALFTDIHMSHIDKERSYKAMAKYAQIYDFDNAQRLNEYARAITSSKHECCVELMDEALLIVQRAIELEPNCQNIDTHAMVLDRIGRKEEAVLQAKKAIELASEDEKKWLRSKSIVSSKE